MAYSFYDGSELKTESVYMINLETGMTVFEKDAEKRRSMASLTKIMTYIITFENVQDIYNEKATVKQDILNLLDKDSSVAELRAGDELSIFDLLHCLMICSGNDAAMVLADYVGKGDISLFIDMMNKKAEELNCENTHFTNPDGIYDEEHYSTALDMYKITRYAMDLPHFMEICGKREYSPFNDERDPIKTTNKMMNPNEELYYCPYVKGIKTGWHSEAGRCLVSFAEKDGISYICVAIGAPEIDIDGDNKDDNMAMIDTKNLYNWAFENLIIKEIAKRTDPFGQIKLDYAWKKDKIILSPEADIKLILPKDMDTSDIETEFNVPDFIEAPVEAGDRIGSAKLNYNGEALKEINLVSGETVQRNFFSFIVDNIKRIIFSGAFFTISIVLLPVGVFYLIFLFAINGKKNKKKRKSFKHNNKNNKK